MSSAVSNQVYLVAPFVEAGSSAQIGQRPRRRHPRPRRDAFGYSAAQKKKPMLEWTPGGGSADEDLLPDLAGLRDRARDLYRNNPLAAGAVDTLGDNVVGTGFTPQSRIDHEAIGWTEGKAKAIGRLIERHFQKWSCFTDSQDRLHFHDYTAVAFQQTLDNGEVFILRRDIQHPRRPYGLCYEMIEADRVSTPYGRIREKNLRDGVIFGENGNPIGYYINKRHPGDSTVIKQGFVNQWEKVPRYDTRGRLLCNHIYQMKRPDQSRGVPWLAPVIDAIKQLCDYMEAEVIAAHVNACFATAIKTNRPASTISERTDTDLTTSSDIHVIESFEPGMNYYLEPEEDLVMVDPNRPNSDAARFIEVFCRMIGAALGLSIEMLLKDFSKTNYSSARAALLEARRNFRRRQQWLIRKWAQPAYEHLTEELVLPDKLPITYNEFTALQYEITRTRWIVPRWGWIDPSKEVEAAAYAVERNLDTASNIYAENGDDWEECYQQIAREKEYRKKLGIEPSEPARRPNAPGPRKKDDGTDND